ncbi:MAG: hypothetical protein IJC61_03170, partial [Oscillospiraceae bacterium]|nr:hypothetical protein [Oscillospiraceae bacterium]
MSVCKKLGTTKCAALTIAAAALLWSVAARVFLLLPFAKSFGFIGFQLLFIALPGMAALKLLRVSATPLQALCASYGLGMLAVVAVYFLCVPFGLQSYALYMLLGVAALSAAVLVIKRRQPLSAAKDEGELSVALGFAVLAGVITFVLLSMAYLNPAISGTRTYYHDTLYGVNLVTAAACSFPMQSLMMSGLQLLYHMFYYSYSALLYLVIGLPAFETTTQLSLIAIAPFAAACFVALAHSILKNKKLVLFASAVFCLIPSFFFTHSLYIDTLGFPLSIAYCMLAPVFFFSGQQQSRGINRSHITAVLLLVGALGAKGPLAVSVLFGICFVLLMELIRDKNLLIFPKGLLYAVTFFLFFMLLYGGGKSVGDSMSISPFYSAIRTDFAYLIYEKLPQPLYVALCVIWYCLSLSPIVSLSLAAVIVCLCRCRKADAPLLFAAGAGAEAMVMINLLKQGGSSELYFISGIYPLLFLAGLYAAKRIAQEKPFKKLPAILAAALLVLCLAGDAKDSLGYFTGAAEWKHRFPLGVPAAVHYSVFREEEVPRHEAQVLGAVTPADYEAYLWLKENTPEDAVIVSYRYERDNLYFCGSCFSERAFYL